MFTEVPDGTAKRLFEVVAWVVTPVRGFGSVDFGYTGEPSDRGEGSLEAMIQFFTLV